MIRRILAPLVIVIVIVLCAVAAGFVGAWFASPPSPTPPPTSTYPGPHAHDNGHALYTCGMHPWIILSEPGLCPICHMELTPLDPARLTGEIVIDPVTVQNIGVRTAAVVRGPAVRRVRTVGTVAYDQTRIGVVTTRIAGWIETLHVAAEGDRVAAGDPLFDLYSPQLYAAQVEYLLAHGNRGTPGGEALLDSTRTRLAHLGVSQAQIHALEDAGRASRTLTIHSPRAGVVTELLVRRGARIEAGAPTHRVVDLSRVWVLAAIYENQAPFVRLGQSAAVTLPALPGRSFHATVDYIYPQVDAATRQGRVRLVLDNPDGLLKPGMFAAVELESVARDDAVLAPREAVLSTGRRKIAFVSLGQGRFEPREVTTGVSTGDGRVEILTGLGEGERVVTSGQFLLDSESRMQSALAQMTRDDAAEAPPPAAATHDHNHNHGHGHSHNDGYDHNHGHAHDHDQERHTIQPGEPGVPGHLDPSHHPAAEARP